MTLLRITTITITKIMIIKVHFKLNFSIKLQKEEWHNIQNVKLHTILIQ